MWDVIKKETATLERYLKAKLIKKRHNVTEYLNSVEKDLLYYYPIRDEAGDLMECYRKAKEHKMHELIKRGIAESIPKQINFA